MRETILICDDEELVRWSLVEHFRHAGFEVFEAADGASCLAQAEECRPTVALLDLKLPDMDGLTVLRRLRERGDNLPVVMLTAVGSVEPVQEATRLGALNYLTKPFELPEVETAIHDALRTHRARTQVAEVQSTEGYAGMIGAAPAMAKLFDTMRQLEDVDPPSVVITGESGTGKDLIAQAIHRKGPRADAPFVEVDCTAIPDALLESTLFGHERGAFTDAKERKKGLFETAGRGIVFLDELGELPLPLQAKLLRALENHTFRRVGGNQNIQFEATVIAATNRNLKSQVDDGQFRKDLYYRLAVVELHVPPLAARRDDIPLLVDHFLQGRSDTRARIVDGFTEEAMAQLMAYAWPGNVRELRNVVERATLLATSRILSADDLPNAIRFAQRGMQDDCPYELPPDGVSLESVERGLVFQAYTRCEGNQSRAAELLGISRYALRSRIKKYGIE